MTTIPSGTDVLAEASPRPWSVHRTGGHLGIKDAKGRFVFRKAVNMMEIPAYNQLLANVNAMVYGVNQLDEVKSQELGSGPA